MPSDDEVMAALRVMRAWFQDTEVEISAPPDPCPWCGDLGGLPCINNDCPSYKPGFWEGKTASDIARVLERRR
jgi:hypothetical protein